MAGTAMTVMHSDDETATGWTTVRALPHEPKFGDPAFT